MNLKQSRLIMLTVILALLLSACRLMRQDAGDDRLSGDTLVEVVDNGTTLEDVLVETTPEVTEAVSDTTDDEADEDFEETVPQVSDNPFSVNPNSSQPLNASSGSTTNSGTAGGGTNSTKGGVFIPPSCVPNTGWPVYHVVSGDTLVKIANRTGTTFNVLAVANCLTDPNRIRVGQALRVPFVPPPVIITPTPLPPAGDAPSQVPNSAVCWFMPYGGGQGVPLYGHPMSETPYATIISRTWYRVIGRNAVHYYLDAGYKGWIHSENGLLGGNCSNIPWQDTKQGIYYPDPPFDPSLCFYYAGRSRVPVYRDRSLQGLMGNLERYLYMIVYGVRDDIVRIQLGATQEGYVRLSDGGLAGNCSDIAEPPDNDPPVGTGVAVESIAGYSFAYPQGWYTFQNTHGLPGGSVASFPVDQTPSSGIEWPAHFTRVSYLTYPDGIPAASVAEWAQELVNQYNADGRTVTTEPTPITLGGVTGVYFEYRAAMRSRVILMQINGRGVEFKADGNVELGVQILNSLTINTP